MRRIISHLGPGLLAVSCLLEAHPARAYRPFTGSNAETGGIGQFTLELGPVEYVRADGNDYVLAPATVLNLGVLPRIEVIVDFVGVVSLPREEAASYQVRWNDVLLKLQLRNGVMQDETGPSAALEAGVLAPGINADRGFGASANLVLSERWDWFVAHLNNRAQLSRGDLFFGWGNSLIAEFRCGEAAWPVAELLWEYEFSTGAGAYSALVGGVWFPVEALKLDVAAVIASVDGEPGFEGRLGLTWAFSIWRPAAAGAD